MIPVLGFLKSYKGIAVIAVIGLIVGIISLQSYQIKRLQSKLVDKSAQLTLARENERGLMAAIEFQNESIQALTDAKRIAQEKSNKAVTRFVQSRKATEQAIKDSKPGVQELNKWLKQFFSVS